jgi:sulfur relay protein TusB/DsrH
MLLNEKLYLLYLYGYSIRLESKLNIIKQILENQLNHGAQITFVFIHDAVIGTAFKHKASPLMKELLQLPINFHSMIPDLKARGIDPENLQSGIESIDYEDLVEILASASKIVSWM